MALFTPRYCRVLFLLSLLLILSAVTVGAQHYDFAAASGTFTPVTGAIAIDDIEADEGLATGLPIGFNFQYFGATYSSFAASSNGYISFSSAPFQQYSNVMNGNTSLLVAPLWDDLSGSGGTASYVLTGSAPNRIMTIEWFNWKWYYLSTGSQISFQVKLYETSNKIEFIYRQEVGILASPSASIGLTSLTFNQYYSLSNSSSSPTFALDGEDNINAKPATGQIYSFTPGTATVPSTQATNVTAPTIGPFTATLSWSNGNGNYRAVFITQTTSTTSFPTLVNGTRYYPDAEYGDGNVDNSFTWYCVYNGTGNTVNVTGLSSSLMYRVFVVEYNGIAGAQTYKTTAGTNNPVNFTTQLAAPVAPVSEIVGYNVSTTAFTYNLNEGNGSKRAIFIKAGVDNTAPAVDNTTYTANTIFGSGSQVGSTGWYCIFNGTSISSPVTVTGLSNNLTYSVHVVDYNGAAGVEKYNLTLDTDNRLQFTTFITTAAISYDFVASSGSFTPITGATAINAIEGDDQVSGAIPIGFSFEFAKIPFTQVIASSNGFLSFNPFQSNYFAGSTNNLFNSYSQPLIAPLWDDLDGAGFGGQASYITTGSAPNRVFTIEYLNWQWDWSVAGAVISFQVKLYETTNKIEFIYRQEATPADADGASIGLAYVDSGTNNFLSLNNSGATPTASSTVQTFNILTRPATGQIYSFTPKTGQTITFNTLTTKTFGDAPFALTGTASSGLTVSYSSSNTAVATISGSTVTIVGAGATTITASQAGDATYGAAANVAQTLTVSKANQTITFGALAAKTFGDAAFTLTGSSSSALALSYSSSNTAVATVSGSTVTIVGAGTATITAAQVGNTNYNAATSVPQTLTVNKANQTITFGALVAKTFGDAAFALTGSSSSALALSYSSSNTAVATVSGSTVTIVGAGTATITAAQAGTANYNVATSVPQTLMVNKANQTVTFAALAARTYGNAPFALTGTTSSGLTVSYTSSNTAVATVSGSTVTIVGVGTSTITADQAGNTNYNVATSVPQTLTVSKANQTITFGALAAKVFGDANFTLGATTTSGLTITYSSSNTAVATVSGNTVTIVGGGTTTITAVQAGNANYNAATSVPQTLTVNKANQTITFSTLATKIFGDAAFGLTASASSGLGITFSSSNTAVATISGSTVTIIGAGSTTITAAQAGNANYNAATSVPQTLIVSKANQTITFGALAAKTFGGAAFTIAATATSSLGVTFTSSNTAVATVSGNTVTIVGGGTATITAAQAGNANYNAATSVPQTLTVNKANQTITFGALAAKTFGDAAFALTGTASSGLTVSYNSSNTAVATISGNTVTIVGGGTTTITASQVGNANYNPVTSPQTLTVNKANQTITFGPLVSKKLSDGSFTLGGTVTSGLTITYASSNTSVATVSGNTVTLIGSGTTTFTASQAGNTNYNAATSVPQTQTVTIGDQTITFTQPADKTFGEAPFALIATSSSGLTVTYVSANTSVATISGSTVTIVAPGTTNITASQAGNSSFNPATNVIRTLTVNKASQTISFAALSSKLEGDASFTLNATSSSGLAISYSSSNTSVATVSGNTVTIIAAGTTNITASQAGNANYNASAPVTQPFLVQGGQTITFASLTTKTFGDAAFNLSGTASSALPVSYASSNVLVATVSGTTVTIVGAGTTDITASQAGDANFTAANPVTRTLTVAKASQTVTFVTITDKTAGDAPFTLTASGNSGLPVVFTTTSDKVTISGSQVTIVKAGSVTIKAEQAGNGNFNPASAERTFCINPAKPIVTTTGLDTESPVLTSSSISGNQWLKDGVTISGATNTVFTVTEAGIYTVKVSADNCSSVVSENVILVITGSELPSNDGVHTYPNPVENELIVDISSMNLKTPATLSMVDASGKEIESKTSKDKTHFDVQAYKAGIYLLNVRSNNGTISRQIIKK